MKKLIPALLLILTTALLTSCYNNYNKDAKSKSLRSTGYAKAQTRVVTQKTKHTVKTKITDKKTYAYNYRVFGKSYKVMSSSRNYQEVGTASWYGYPFHHRYTSSGERYNMYQLTAAHKTLPLKTYVVVTNLKNKKQVVVKINDRGPFVGNRVIDLSYAAAKKLGMVGLGVTQVSIKAISRPSALA